MVLLAVYIDCPYLLEKEAQKFEVTIFNPQSELVMLRAFLGFQLINYYLSNTPYYKQFKLLSLDYQILNFYPVILVPGHWR